MAKSYNHWYARYPGDYMRKTQHLSLMEVGAYDRLMDWYYANSKPIPKDRVQMHRICNAIAPEEQEAVDKVLHEFFKEEEDGWHNARADEELQKKADISEKRRKAQEIREQKRKSKGANAPASDTANDDTATSTATAKDSKESYMNDFEDFWREYPRQRRGNKQKAQRAYKRALTRATEEEIHNGLKAYIRSEEVRSGFAKGAEAWLNDDRWTIEYQSSPKPPARNSRQQASGQGDKMDALSIALSDQSRRAKD